MSAKQPDAIELAFDKWWTRPFTEAEYNSLPPAMRPAAWDASRPQYKANRLDYEASLMVWRAASGGR